MPRAAAQTRQEGLEPRRRVSASDVMREADLERYVCDYLALDGWRVLKMEQNFSEKKRRTFGEGGMPDRMFLRYEPKILPTSHARRVEFGDCAGDILWIEFKRHKYRDSKGKMRYAKTEQHQHSWIAAERARGALVLLAGADFPATPEGFRAWYESSGLMRRRLR